MLSILINYPIRENGNSFKPPKDPRAPALGSFGISENPVLDTGFQRRYAFDQ